MKIAEFDGTAASTASLIWLKLVNKSMSTEIQIAFDVNPENTDKFLHAFQKSGRIQNPVNQANKSHKIDTEKPKIMKVCRNLFYTIFSV